MQIYLDNSATTPLLPEVVEAMKPYWSENYGNPSSPHSLGVAGERVLTNCRLYLAQLLGVSQQELIFTSGGTEANNLAILGFAYNTRKPGHIITTSIEHLSVLHAIKHLEDQHNWQVSYLPVNEYGLIDLEQLINLIQPNTGLISIGLVNNEIGTIQNINKIGKLINEYNQQNKQQVLLHVDAVQALGHLPLEIKKNNIHLLTVSGHKIFGPKGSGLLYCNDRVRLQPLFFGGGQEKGLRSGTENLPAIVGFTKACQLAIEQLDNRSSKLNIWYNQLLEILKTIPGYFLNSPANGAPHIINIGFSGIKSEMLVHFLEEKGIYVSMGAACSGRRQTVSHVLQEIGCTPEQAGASIRISMSPFHTSEEIEYAGATIRKTVDEIRRIHQ